MTKYHYDEFNNNEYEVHKLAFDLILRGSRVLDIGCATGYLARELSKKECETWGVDNDEKAAKKAAKYCKKVVVCNLDQTENLSVPMKYFDYVIILDVLEHLLHPENILSIIKKHIKDGGRVIISIPNIAHASIRWMLLTGRFDYSTTGILDYTHVRFYTINSIGKLLNKNGYKTLKIIPTNGMCKVPFLYKISDRLPASWQYSFVKKFPSLFAFQFISVTKKVS